MTAGWSAFVPSGRARRPGGSILGVGGQWRRWLPPALACGDMAAAAVAVSVVLDLRFGSLAPDLRVGTGAVPYAAAGLVLVPTWALVLGLHRVYGTRAAGPAARCWRTIVQAGGVLLAVIAVAHLILGTGLTGRLVIAAVGLTVALTVALRLALSLAEPPTGWASRTLVVGPRAAASAVARQLGREPAVGLEVVGTYALADHALADPGGEDAVPEPPEILSAARALGVDVVVLTGRASAPRLRSLAWALENNQVALMVAPAVAGLTAPRPVATPAGDLLLMEVRGCRLGGARLAAKNVGDRVGAAVLLGLLAPLMAAVAVAVRVSSGGPVLYRQQRLGRGGRSFTFLKFRTMVSDADARLGELAERNEADGLLFKIVEDPRVTSVGRFLRRTSLDELPQLWNVLRGDMSLVGPRPLPIRAHDLVGEARRRLRVKPGLTGLWQVSGRSDLSWEETVRLDLHYVDRWSLGLDLTILLRTPAAVLAGRGAY